MPRRPVGERSPRRPEYQSDSADLPEKERFNIYRYRTIAVATLILNLVFGITAFEAQVLSASDGRNGIACVLDIKTGTRRQSELVRLVHSIAR